MRPLFKLHIELKKQKTKKTWHDRGGQQQLKPVIRTSL